MPNIFSAKNVLVLNHVFGLLLNCGCIVCAAFMSDSLNQATRRSKWVLKEPEGKGVEVPSPSANFVCQISHLPASFLPSTQPIFVKVPSRSGSNPIFPVKKLIMKATGRIIFKTTFRCPYDTIIRSKYNFQQITRILMFKYINVQVQRELNLNININILVICWILYFGLIMVSRGHRNIVLNMILHVIFIIKSISLSCLIVFLIIKIYLLLFSFLKIIIFSSFLHRWWPFTKGSWHNEGKQVYGIKSYIWQFWFQNFSKCNPEKSSELWFSLDNTLFNRRSNLQCWAWWYKAIGEWYWHFQQFQLLAL